MGILRKLGQHAARLTKTPGDRIPLVREDAPNEYHHDSPNANIYLGDPEPDGMEEAGYQVRIYHIPSKTEIGFKAYITDFNDQFQQSWNKEQVFGRNDQHTVFKGTERIITIGWKVLATDFWEAEENMKKLSLLAQMQYPTYNSAAPGTSTGIINANAIQASPIFRLKFLNWISDAKSGMSPKASAADSGLVGTMAGFTFDPNMEMPLFIADDGAIYASEINVSLSYTVLHTHPLGWRGRGARQKAFPYAEKLTTAGDNRSEIRSEKVRNNGGSTIEQRAAKEMQMANGNFGEVLRYGPDSGGPANGGFGDVIYYGPSSGGPAK